MESVSGTRVEIKGTKDQQTMESGTCTEGILIPYWWTPEII